MAEQKTILIVDDDAEILNLLKNFLEEKNFNTLVAETGTRAIELSSQTPPDLMITDLLLPGMHGIDLVKTIKDQYHIPVIVISGVYKGGELSDFLESSYVDTYFIKPFKIDQIYEELLSLLNE